MHRGAAEDAALGVVQVEVCRVDGQERRDFVHQPLQHALELELCGDGLRGPQQPALLAQPLVVLLQELRDVDREADLARDGLRDGDV